MNLDEILLKIKEKALEDKLKSLKVLVIILIIVGTLGSFIIGKMKDDKVPTIENSGPAVQAEADNVNFKEKSTDKTIVVDIGGAVQDPSVVELKRSARIDDAINAAGGLTATADLTDINRAAFCKDGEKIYIPNKGEKTKSKNISGSGLSSINSLGQIDLNSASKEELETLVGVGPVMAQKIIDYRDEKGGFYKIEDLKKVNGIGDKTFEKIKDDVVI